MEQLKRRDMGVAGALIVLAQVLSTLSTSRNLSGEIDQLKAEFHKSKIEQEKYFVKKKELKKVIVKLDSMKVQLAGIRQQIKTLKPIAFNEEMSGCSYEQDRILKDGRI